MRFLFWNTKKKSIDNYIVRLINEYNIDLFCAAEYGGNAEELCSRIRADRSFEVIMSPGCERVILFGNPSVFTLGFQNKYCSMHILNDSYLICVVHLPSKLHNDDIRREIIISEIVNEINKVEDTKMGNNTVVIGDFNINPYEESCLRIDQFHSIPVEIESLRGSRVFNGKDYKMFYNPMWNLFGDNIAPFGTYYKNSGESICPFWNIYDQVLIRPSLISRFNKEQLRIITNCNDESLLDANYHPRKEISDHLPIVFELEV